MKDIDENGVDRMERFQGYSQRFTQFSVADEVYRETLEYMKHLRNERDAMRKQRDEAVRALKEIAHQDYRGHPSTESQIAMNALAAMRKGESHGK